MAKPIVGAAVMTVVPPRLPVRALAAWPRFLLTHVAGGAVLGPLFTAAILHLDPQGVGSLVLGSDMAVMIIGVMAFSCAALTACGMLATAMAQFDAYPPPPPAR